MQDLLHRFMIMYKKQGKTCKSWYHGPCVKISKANQRNFKKAFVSTASNLTRLEIETDRYVKNIVFATTFFHLVAGKKAT